MATYGITTTGFNKKTLDILLSQFETILKASSEYGPDYDFTSNDPLYQLTAAYLTTSTVESWENAEDSFNNISVLRANGVNLSNRVRDFGVTKRQAATSKGQITIDGPNGTIIPIGFIIGTSQNIRFQTTTTGTISSGTVTLEIESLLKGSTNDVTANSITNVITPLTADVTVTNQSATTGGQDEETDTVLKQRFRIATEGSTGPQAQSIRNRILGLSGVNDAVVFENDTNSTVDNIPPHSVRVLVSGGSNDDVGRAIFETIEGSTPMVGVQVVSIVDSQGLTKNIQFDRPVDLPVWINAVVSSNSRYPDNGDELINDGIIDFINNVLGVGADLSPYKVCGYIDSLNIPGIENVIITVSIDGVNFVGTVIEIEADQDSVTDSGKVVVS